MFTAIYPMSAGPLGVTVEVPSVLWLGKPIAVLGQVGYRFSSMIEDSARLGVVDLVECVS